MAEGKYSIDKILSLLDKMAENETAIQNLYLDYATSFPSQKEFWNKISLEEQMHAEILVQSKSKINKGSINSNINFTEEAANIFIKYVKQQRDKNRTGNVDLKEALATALNLEQSMLESHYFDVLSLCQSPDIQKQLFNNTREHAQRIKDAIKQIL